LKENHQLNDNDSSVEIEKKKQKKLNSTQEQQIEDLEKKLIIKDNAILKLQVRLADTEEMLLNVIADKKNLDEKINHLELKDLNLKIGNFEELKMEHSKLAHRTQITKKQLDEARAKIKSQIKYVEDAKKRVEFMETVINDLENRGLKDFLRSRYPESFLEYQNEF
jgi:chromosome segregation ATPase